MHRLPRLALTVDVQDLEVGDTRVHLRTAKGKEGDSKVGATVASRA